MANYVKIAFLDVLVANSIQGCFPLPRVLEFRHRVGRPEGLSDRGWISILERTVKMLPETTEFWRDFKR